MNRIFIASVFLFFTVFTACGSSETETAMTDSVDTAVITGNRYDTVFSYSPSPHMQVYRNDTLIESMTFKDETDTTFYPDGCVHEITIRNERDFEEFYQRFDHDHVLRFTYTCYSHDGMGGTVANREMYDTTGVRTESEYNKDYMPDDAQGHLDVCGVVTTTAYYRNGYTKSIERRDHHYEGGYYCPCGDWEYRDSLGNVTKREHYKKCGDGKTNCVDVFLEEQKKDSARKANR